MPADVFNAEYIYIYMALVRTRPGQRHTSAVPSRLLECLNTMFDVKLEISS